MPLDLPPGYPNELRLRTKVVIGKAHERFPKKYQILDLCGYVVAELTPHFCSMVESKKIQADPALGHMEKLLRYILVANSGDSSESYQLNERMRESVEYRELTNQLEELEGQAGERIAKPGEVELAEAPKLHGDKSGQGLPAVDQQNQPVRGGGVDTLPSTAPAGESKAESGEEELKVAQAAHSESSPRITQKVNTSDTLSIKVSGVNPDIVKRRTIIAQNPEMTARQLCGQFDLDNIPLVEQLRKDFPDVKNWMGAYQNPRCRPRVDTLISKDRL